MDNQNKSELLVELKNVGLKFTKKKSLLRAKKSNEFWALKDVSFNLYRGEVLGVTGRNGAGKSTLLSIIAGIISPTTGTANIYTENISLLSLQAGFVPFLTGRKNIFLSGMLLGLDYDFICNKIQDIIDFAELGTFIDQPVATYSSGMKARLGFSTSIYLNPDIILIDEALGVGDKEFQEKSSSYLKSKLKDTNQTAVIVSHNQRMLDQTTTRIIRINNGTLK